MTVVVTVPFGLAVVVVVVLLLELEPPLAPPLPDDGAGAADPDEPVGGPAGGVDGAIDVTLSGSDVEAAPLTPPMLLIAGPSLICGYKRRQGLSRGKFARCKSKHSPNHTQM